MKFWIELILSFPQSVHRTLREFAQRKIYWMVPLVVFLLLTAVFLLVVGSVQPLAPFIYSLI